MTDKDLLEQIQVCMNNLKQKNDDSYIPIMSLTTTVVNMFDILAQNSIVLEKLMNRMESIELFLDKITNPMKNSAQNITKETIN